MKKYLILSLFFSFFVFSGCTQNMGHITPVNNIPVTTSTSEVNFDPIEPIPLDSLVPDDRITGTCQENGGTWLNEYWECENVSLKWCEEHNGVFDGCGSACRHQSTSTVCTLQCVPVCILLSEESDASSSAITNILLPEVCNPCRTYSAPAPNWCSGGKIIIPEKDRCGCVGHLICE